MSFSETCVKSNVVYNGKIVKLHCDEASLPNGKLCTREYVEHGGGSCVLFVKDNKILLVRQFHYPYGEELWELPAGKLNAGEDPENTARRELEEETGYIPEELSLMQIMYPSPGYTNEKIYIYRAVRARAGAVHLDEDEFLNSYFVPVEEVREMIARGEIRDAKTIVGVQGYLLSGK